jgi:hypothetical protein
MKDCISVCGDGVAGWQEIVCEVKWEMDCNEGLYQCVLLWCGYPAGNSVRSEAGNKV